MAHNVSQARASVMAFEDEAVRCAGCKNRTGVGQVAILDGVAFCTRRCACRREVFPPKGGCVVEMVG